MPTYINQMSDQGLFSVTERSSLVPCSHGPIGHALLGSAENLNISIFLDRRLVNDFVLEIYLPGQTSRGTDVSECKLP